VTDPAVPERDQQEQQPLSPGPTPTNRSQRATELQTQKAALANQSAILADQLVKTRELSGRQEAGQITAAAATQEQELWTGQSILVSLAAVADLLTFSDQSTQPPTREVGGCSDDGRPDLFGITVGVKPGETVNLVTASPSQVVLQYTHSYSWELAAAGQIADRQCQRFGRHAALVSTARESVDRSVATFRCVCVGRWPTDGTVH
jgi:hypothetical protein